MPSSRTRAADRPSPAGLATFVVVVLGLGPSLASGASAAETQRDVAVASAPRAIRVERESFWYDTVEPRPDPNGRDWSAPGAVQRLADALAEILRRYADDFPQPPPVTTVIRAADREQLVSNPVWSITVGSYGCARLADEVVTIEIAPSAFVGRDALNDAELRSFLGHELVHAYQFVRGEHGSDPGEIARREVEALQWELANLDPDVRQPYRDDIATNLTMYRAIVGAPPEASP
jgi:hypothetical protein